MHFFRLQDKRRFETECLSYDSTSLSSYSEPMKQFNLSILFGEENSLPFYYRKIASNIPDVKTVRELIRKLDILEEKVGHKP